MAKVRQIINLRYMEGDYIKIFGTLVILLAIPLTVFVTLQSRGLRSKAAQLLSGALSSQSIVEPGSMVSRANYIVFIDGANYYVKDGKTGAIKFSGTGDAAPVINWAINDLPSNGGKVVLSEGTFTITGTGVPEYGTIIPLDNNVTLEGQGRTTIIKLADKQNQHLEFYMLGAFSKSNCVVRNLVVDGNRDNQGSAPTDGGHVGIVFNTVTDGLIENVEVKNINAIRITDPKIRVYGGNGIDVGAGSNVIVRNSTIHNIWEHGIAVGAAAKHHIIENNVLYDIGMPPPGLAETGGKGIMVQQGDYIVIANNIVYDLNDDDGIQLRMARYSTVVGNYATGDSGIAIITEAGDTIEAVGNTISGNTTGGFRKNNTVGYVGIALTRGGGGTGSAIHDNTIVGNTIANTFRGGILIEGASNNLVEDNVIYDTDHNSPSGPLPPGWGGAAIFVLKSGDKVSDGNLIQGNRIWNDPGHYQDFGIWVNTGCSGNVVRNNDISGMIQATIRNDGMGTIIQNNIGYRTENSGTVTIPIGSTYVDVDHGLATTPTRVLITSTTNPGGKSYWVSDKNVGVTGTKFRISLSSAHTASINFDWQALIE